MIALETKTFRWELDEAGRNLRLLDLDSGADHLGVAGTPAVLLRRNGRELAPETASFTGKRLTFRFSNGGRVVLAVDSSRPAYLVLTVQEVDAGAFDRLDFLNVPLADAPAAIPDAFSLCAVAQNIRTRVDDPPGPQQHLFAACYPKFGVTGAGVAVVGTRFCELRKVLQRVVAEAEGLPASPLGGPWALDAPDNRRSYLFGVPTEETVDEWIRLCRDFGCSQLHFCGGGAFRLGDYTPSPEWFPDGVDEVARVVRRLHEADIQAGLHTLSFSIAKNSRYVTPRPDPRLGVDTLLTLAADIGPDDSVVPVREPTDGMPRRTSYHIRTSMTLMIDDELIDYRRVRTSSEPALIECVRGAYGTTPAPHRAGTQVRHLKACWSMFAPDPDSSLFPEIAANIAGLINAAQFDMVYLDGLDGAHIFGGESGRWHYGGRFAFEVFERLDRPIIMEMAAFLHHLWFLRSRMGAWDHPVRGHKTFIDYHCRSNANFARIFLPAHLGWWAPRVRTGPKDETTFAEDVALLCTRALAGDVSFSLQGVSPQAVRATPHLARVAPIFRTYEALRRSGTVPAHVRAALAQPGAEFALETDVEGAPRFFPQKSIVCTLEPDAPHAQAVEIRNPMHEQSPFLRLEALWSAADYTDPDGVELVNFATPDEFDDNGDVLVILNSGKDYTYPSAAPGMSSVLSCIPCAGPHAGRCGVFEGTRRRTTRTVRSSGPDDEFSILDHGERFFRPRVASWVRIGKRFQPELDLGERQALGFYVHGDGSGAVLNVQVRSAGRFFSFSDHYVILDFDGWRYVELIEPESDRRKLFSWPYGRSVYKLHRHGVEYDAVSALHLWLNNVPADRTVRVMLSPIRALPIVRNTLKRPVLWINDRRIEFPADLDSGDVLECTRDGLCTMLSRTGEERGRFRMDPALWRLPRGRCRVRIECESAAPRPRARVTFLVRSRRALRG